MQTEQSPNFPPALADELIQVRIPDLLKQLDPNRIDDRAKWIDLGMALKNAASLAPHDPDADARCLALWVLCSRQSVKFSEGEGGCGSRWEGFTSGGGITYKSLFTWAKEDQKAGLSLDTPLESRFEESSGSAQIEIKPTLTPEQIQALTDQYLKPLANRKLTLIVSPPPIVAMMVEPTKPPLTKPGHASAEAAFASLKVGTLATIYRYDGSFAVARYNKPDGGKEFRPAHLGVDGFWHIAGKPTGLLPLYHRNEIPAAGPICWLEGEGKTDRARKLGLAAVSSAGGSGRVGETDYTPLAGRDVLILPDADGAGRKAALEVAKILLKLVPPARVKIVTLPGLPSAGDIVQFIDARPTMTPESIRTEIESLVSAEPWVDPLAIFGGPVLIRMDSVVSTPVEWSWPGRIAIGCITLLIGKPGAGKTWVTVYITSCVSTGSPWPDGSPCKRGSVILINGEDDLAYTLRPRLDAHGADVSRVRVLATVRRPKPDGTMSEAMFSLSDIEALETALKSCPDCRLIVIDPIGSFLGGDVDSYRDNEVRSVLAPLASLAAKYHVAVLVVAHRKKGGGSAADEMALGSVAFTGLARTVLHATIDPDNPERRLLLPGKNNLGPSVDGLAFSVTGNPAAISWEKEPVKMTADEVLAKERDTAQQRAPRLNAAIDWLRNFLSVGPKPSQEVFREGMKDGNFSKDTLGRASEKINVDKRPAGFRGSWVWSLPTADINTAVEEKGTPQ